MTGGLDRSEGEGRTILVVDDDVAVRVLLRTVLERMHFKVELAEDGEAALRKLRNTIYSVLLLDLMMPRVSGFDVLEKLQHMPEEVRPHVIVFTAAGQTGIDRIPAESVCATIRKPFDLSTFLATVRDCMDRRHNRALPHEV